MLVLNTAFFNQIPERGVKPLAAQNTVKSPHQMKIDGGGGMGGGQIFTICTSEEFKTLKMRRNEFSGSIAHWVQVEGMAGQLRLPSAQRPRTDPHAAVEGGGQGGGSQASSPGKVVSRGRRPSP